MRSRSVRAALAIVVAAIACVDDSPIAVVDNTDVRLSIHAQVIGSPFSHVVEIDVSYLATNGVLNPLPVVPRRVGVNPGTTRQQPVSVNVMPCLSDPERVGAADGGCRLHVKLRLLDSTGAVTDSSIVEPAESVQPGETVEIPGTSLSGCGPVVPQPAGTLLEPIVPEPGGLRSPSFAVPANVRFTNGSCDSVFVYNIDFTGAPVLRARLGPGQSHVQATWATHLWLVANDDGRSTLHRVPSNLSASEEGVVYIPRRDEPPSTEPAVAFTAEGPPQASVGVGRTGVVHVALRDAQGAPIIGQTVTWSVDNGEAVGLSAGTSITTASGATVIVRGRRSGVSTIVSARAAGLDIPVPVLTFPPWMKISAGEQHTCGLFFDGSPYCWGRNDAGELGVPPGGETCTFGTQAIACSRTPVAVAGGLRFGWVTAGGDFTCGRTTDNRVYCWGGNGLGQLGEPSAPGAFSPPVEVSGNRRFLMVDAGWRHSCGVITGGEVYCWGLNDRGQLGVATSQICDVPTGPAPCSRAPVRVPLPAPALYVGAGFWTSCAILETNATYCWGDNAFGNFGDGTTTSTTSPTPALSGLLAQKVSVGSVHTCAIDLDGSAHCAGENRTGALGNGTFTTSFVPVRVSGPVFRELAASEENNIFAHTCGMTVIGETYCWGANNQGQLGTVATEQCSAGSCSSVPLPLTAVGHTGDITTGLAYTCAASTSNAAYCWGSNVFGNLGDGTVTNRTSPVLVADPAIP